MKRVISLWLPSFATDRLIRRRVPSRRSKTPTDVPLATVTAAHGGIRVVAASRPALEAGVAPGLTLAEARALLPDLAVAEANPGAERKTLDALAEWCGRYTPWTAIDRSGERAGDLGGDAGLWLNVSGCAHLFGGEAALLDDLVKRLSGFGFTAAAAVADTPGAAWAAARFAGAVATVLPSGETAAPLAPLPVAGLRLPPAVIEDLGQIGLYRIGDLSALPRGPLAARFGDVVLKRLDQALGRIDEPLSPRRPLPAMMARLAFAEPIRDADDIARATSRLLVDLCVRLAVSRQGARRLELTLYRTDGTVTGAAIGTSRPVHDPDHLQKLFREGLDGLDAGFGIEIGTVAATVVEPLSPVQMALSSEHQTSSEGLARLIDRFGNRLNPENVMRLIERPSHVPERANRPLPAFADHAGVATAPAGAPCRNGERSRQPRPLILLSSPEPIEVIAPVPDGPPVMFRWGQRRHKVIVAEGPERIGPEWWLEPLGHDPERQSRIRDYYRIEDGNGRRFWVYREGFYRPGIPPRWYVHGLFP